MCVALLCLTSNDTANVKVHPSCKVWCAEEVSDARLMHDDGKEVLRVVNSDAPRLDADGLDGLSVPLTHCGPFCATRRRRSHAAPPGISVAGPTTDREWEHEHALDESQSAAVRLAAKAKAAPMRILSVSSELVADSEGDVCSRLGESYVDSARR